MNLFQKILLVVAVLFMLGALLFTHYKPESNYDFGAWSLLPPLIAILLAFITRQVFLSLTVGVFIGSAMMSEGNFFQKLFFGFTNSLQTVVKALADEFHIGIVIFTLAIGGMVGVIAQTGGMKAIANALAKKAQSVRSTQFYTFLIGIAVFFDDYANSLIIGPTMRPLTELRRISREKLSFILDATAAPIAGLAFISTWIGYEVGLIGDALKAANIEGNAYGIFLQTIPYRYYNILMLFFIPFLIVLLRDFGPMLKAERRARTTGKTLNDDAQVMAFSEIDETRTEIPESKLKIRNALLPILTLIVVSLVGLWYNGGGLEQPFNFVGIRDAFGNADSSVVLLWASVFASIVALFLGVSQKFFTINEGIETWIKGVKSLIIAVIILTCAWSIGSITESIGAANYVVKIVSNSLPGGVIPIIVFVISCVVAFSTGTSWGTMAIMMPIAVPLAASYAPGIVNDLQLATIGACLTGAIFGDHCSPISDTTIMASMGASCDHLDHVKTQLPYAIVVALVSIVFCYLPLALGMNTWIAMIVGIVICFLIVRFYGKSTESAEEPVGVETARTFASDKI